MQWVETASGMRHCFQGAREKRTESYCRDSEYSYEYIVKHKKKCPLKAEKIL